jgi:hypothetical protein
MRRGQSTARAIKRGHMTPEGFIVPTRPFNNRKRTLGRDFQVKKENIYGQIKQRGLQ